MYKYLVVQYHFLYNYFFGEWAYQCLYGKATMRHSKTDHKHTHISQKSVTNMGRILIEELNESVAQVDFEAMLSRSSHLARFAKNNTHSQLLINDLTSMAQASALGSMVAIEAASQMHHQDATKLLIDCLSQEQTSVRRQATYKLAHQQPDAKALPLLLSQLYSGGIDTMHAHHTLEQWSYLAPDLIIQCVSNALLINGDALIRARLVDLLGALKGAKVTQTLVRIAADIEESSPVRIAAISALGSPRGDFTPSLMLVLNLLAKQDNDIGAYATLAAYDQTMQHSPQNSSFTGGLRVCQLVLAQVDQSLSFGGCGETGGVASLLVSLSDALTRQQAIGQVITLGLGSVEDAINAYNTPKNTPQPFHVVNAGDALRPMNSTNAWEHLPALKRSIKRCLGHFGGVDLMHLRMLDAGTFAAANVANALDIPVCFSFAPDPQNTVQSMRTGKQLTSDDFLNADAQSNLWFRARMLEKMARTSSHVALFPQPKCALLLQDIRKDLSHQTQQSVTIAEGIDIKLIREAALHYSPSAPRARNDVIVQLEEKICPTRRHLPLLLSVGRLHPIKGMARIVAAWAANPLLHNTCNLVMVGGNLNNPSIIETSVIQAIDAAMPTDDPRRAGLIMLGGRPRADTAQLMVATMMGRSGYWADGGIYVDGAPKEEFGLALIEALATGLVVVAPSTGGPASFVDHGDTGVLVDPDHNFGQSIVQGFALVGRAGRILKAQTMVEQRYAIDTMAEKLTSLYATVKD